MDDHEARRLLARRIHQLIDAAGLSVLAFETERLGKTRGYVSDALAGRKRLTVELIVECLEALGLPLSSFFRLNDPADEVRERGGGWYSQQEVDDLLGRAVRRLLEPEPPEKRGDGEETTRLGRDSGAGR